MSRDELSGIGTAPPGDLGEVLDFMRLVWALDHALQRKSSHMAATLGVTGPQRLVLRMLGKFPGIPAGELAAVLHVHPSTLTGILRRLERRGLIARRPDPRDRRRAFLGLTAKGRELDGRSSDTVEATLRATLALLPARKTRHAAHVLSALISALEQATPRPGEEQASRGEPEVLLVGLTRVRNHCTFTWQEPEGGGTRSVEIRPNHCDRCIAEVRERGYRLLRKPKSD